MRIPTDKEINNFWEKVFNVVINNSNMSEQIYKLKPEYSHLSQIVIGSIAIGNRADNHKDTYMSRGGDIFRFNGDAVLNLKNAGVLDLWFDKVEPSKLDVTKEGDKFRLKFTSSNGATIEFTITEQMFADLRDYFRAL